MHHILLDRVRRADADDLIAANLANTDYHAPWVAPFVDLAGFDAWYAGQLTGPNVSLLARRASDRQPVAVFNISAIVMGVFQSAYLGYYGYRETGGQGLATAAMRAAIRYAFEELGLHRLEANIQPGNARSIALVQRAGMRREGFSPAYLKIGGVWCDHERWAITREDTALDT